MYRCKRCGKEQKRNPKLSLVTKKLVDPNARYGSVTTIGRKSYFCRKCTRVCKNHKYWYSEDNAIWTLPNNVRRGHFVYIIHEI